MFTPTLNLQEETSALNHSLESLKASFVHTVLLYHIQEMWKFLVFPVYMGRVCSVVSNSLQPSGL